MFGPLAGSPSASAPAAMGSARHGLAGVLLGAAAIATAAHAESRGELLYSTHCIACHTSQMHWRDKKAATDWTSLKFQVQRWQSAAGLDWSEADIQDVTRYLNESIYRYAPASNPLTLDLPAMRRHRPALPGTASLDAGAGRPNPSVR